MGGNDNENKKEVKMEMEKEGLIVGKVKRSKER